jgi:NADH:ubiquinone oxidoreductase subunit C
MTDVSPSVGALEAEFGSAILRNTVSCGDSIVFVTRERAHDVLAWLKDAPGQEFNFLTDITAVEYRDAERPLEVVYQLRSLERKADLRIKVPLDKTQPLELDTVYDLWKGADWLERSGRTSRSGDTSAGLNRCVRPWPPIPRHSTPWKSWPSPRACRICPPT